MAIHSGPEIPNSGLVYNLDAANPKNFGLGSVQVLVVAGGGGGGGGNRYVGGGGGGGGGGIIYSNNTSVTPGTAYTITVGNGGTGSQNINGTSGGNSSAFGLTAIGGGGGGRAESGISGLSGGSGGGGGGSTAGSQPGGAGTSGQGYTGGTGSTTGNYNGAGGGGAAAVGKNGTQDSSGGSGLAFSISGSDLFYGGGGAGGTYTGPATTLGGLGGGGNSGTTNGTAGSANTGGGGGGSGIESNTATVYTPGNGGSGIVIVRYPGPQRAIGGTVTRVGNDTVHTFTSVGSTTFTPLATGTLSGLADQSNLRNFATPTNGPTWNSSNNGIVNFDGSDDYIITSTATALGINSVTTPFTISAWFKTSGAGEYYLLDNYNGNTADISLRIDGGKMEVYLNASNNVGFAVPQFGSGYNNNAWHNFTLVWNGINEILAYIDGIYSGNSIQNGLSGSFDSGAALQIGSRPTSSSYFPGSISQVQIYNRALSAAEVAQLFESSRGRYGV